ncbi:MAG: EAL domain-containing protein [Methylophaga sp.]|nr:EAL domain-containing protein [Methylophaga sp.]
MEGEQRKTIGHQAELLYQQTLFANIAIIFTAIALYWLFLDHVSAAILKVWSFTICSVALLRIALWYYHLKRSETASPTTWIKRHVCLTLLMGITWGGTSVFYFLIDDIQINTLFYVLICGVTTAGVPVLSAWFPAYLAYTLPQVMALMVVTLHKGYTEPDAQALSYFLIIALSSYYAMLLSLARRSFKNIVSELKLKYKNDALVNELNSEVEERESLIAERTRELTIVNQQLKQSQAHMLTLSSAVEASPNGIMITDASGTIQYVNPRCEQITGYAAEEVIGKTPQIYRSDKTSSHFYDDMWSSIRAGREWSGELQNRRKNGELYWIKEYVAPIQDDHGEVTHFVAIQEDITEARMLANELSYQATHDNLTGLINRSEFERRLTELVGEAQRNKSTHAMCFVDLDQFKVINDTCGHVAGDELLRQLGHLLMGTVRKSDTLARLGGDEFAILMAFCDLKQAEKIANEVRERIEQFQFVWEARVFTIGASIGVTSIQQRTMDMTEVLKQADTACYAAKNLGRNRVYLYHDEDTHLVRQQGELHWVNEIKQALSEDRFELFVQPIVSTQKGDADSYEVLLRLRSEQGDLAPPSAFLPSAERYNLSDKVDRWVVDKTLSWLDKHRGALPKLKQLAINLSGASLGNDEMLDFISSKLKKVSFPASKIKFEITETAAISNLREATHLIRSMAELGCEFSLDDFGSGLSSFGYLKQLPVHSIKIDGMFVKDMIDDPLDFEMVKSINDIGHVMGLETIAEFVENEAVWQKLQSIGVDYGQGYHLGKPQPIDSILSDANDKFEMKSKQQG